MRIFGVSLLTILLLVLALWVGFKYGSKIPVLNGL
jgi:hypothetical protein